MNVFDVVGKLGDSGEYLLGSRDTGSHACYLVYGTLKPGEQGRELKPGNGHEELVLALQGDLHVTGRVTGVLKQGQAIHLKGEEALSAGNPGTTAVVYVIAGGHADEGHH